MIPPVESLVKYDKPVLVSSSREKDKGKGKKETFGVDNKGKALQTEDILNAILPPRCDVWAARAHAHVAVGCCVAQNRICADAHTASER